MKFTVIEAAGKQFVVSAGKKVSLSDIGLNKDDEVIFDKVLAVFENGELRLGQPYLEGESIKGKVLEKGREKKKIVFRYHSKNRYRKFKGHRQPFTEVEILKP